MGNKRRRDHGTSNHNMLFYLLATYTPYSVPYNYNLLLVTIRFYDSGNCYVVGIYPSRCVSLCSLLVSFVRSTEGLARIKR